jgi:HemY protein
VRLGESARQRLVRAETLAAKAPGHLESALAVARAAVDASEFARAREALAPFVAAPTQRVAMLMAEIERSEHGDSGRARAWTLRAVRALHDPVWTADGYVSDRWRPVSPVSGRLDAFRWQTPLAALPSDKVGEIESSPFEEAMLAAPPRAELPPQAQTSQVQTSLVQTPQAGAQQIEVSLPATQDNSPAQPAIEAAPAPAPLSASVSTLAPAAAPPAAEPVGAVPPPLFRTRADIPKTDKGAAPAVPPVIPIVRAPDDPGVDDEPDTDEFAGRHLPAQGQAGGWRGFLARWGG